VPSPLCLHLAVARIAKPPECGFATPRGFEQSETIPTARISDGRDCVRCTALKEDERPICAATMLSAVLILGIALFVYYVVRSVQTYYALRQFGGHWSAGWSRLWLLHTQGSGEMNKRFTAVNRKYGESDNHLLAGRCPARLSSFHNHRHPCATCPSGTVLCMMPESIPTAWPKAVPTFNLSEENVHQLTERQDARPGSRLACSSPQTRSSSAA